MGGLFKAPKIPAAPEATPTPPPAPAPPDNPSVQTAITAERTRAAAAGGRNRTLLVTGTADTALPNRAKTLLGQ